MKIIMYISAASFSFMWINLIAPIACPLGLETLLTATVPDFISSNIYVTYSFTRSTYFWQTYFEGMTIIFNTILSIDLVVTLRRPF